MLKNIFSTLVLASMKSLIRVNFIFSNLSSSFCSSFRVSNNITRNALVNVSIELLGNIYNNSDEVFKHIKNS